MPGRLGRVYTPNPLVRHHRLAPDHWWLTLPGLDGGKFWYDVGGASSLSHGVLTNMGSGSGWRPTARPGGWGYLLVDGVDDYVNVPDAPSLNPPIPYTVSLWLKFTTSANVVVMEKNGNSGFSLQANGGPLTLWSGSAGSGFTTGAINDGNWHHAAFSISAAGLGASYIDGRANGSITGFGPLAPAYGSSTPVYFGSRGGAFGIAAALDDAQLYSRALAAAEVRALYDESRLGYPTLLRRVGRPLGGSAAAILFRRNLMLRAGSRGSYV